MVASPILKCEKIRHLISQSILYFHLSRIAISHFVILPQKCLRVKQIHKSSPKYHRYVNIQIICKINITPVQQAGGLHQVLLICGNMVTPRGCNVWFLPNHSVYLSLVVLVGPWKLHKNYKPNVRKMLDLYEMYWEILLYAFFMRIAKCIANGD
jgi:hypothetical protein